MSDQTQAVFDAAVRHRWNPEAWAMYAWDWGHGDLAKHPGLRKWQSATMGLIGQHLRNTETRHTPLRIAIASGHGIGKSAEIAMVTHWALSTCVDTRVVYTANTEKQLRTKTAPEIAKWFRSSINADWWDVSGLSVVPRDANREKSWRADAIAWSVNNTEAFAGLHNEGRRILIVYDEASGIDDKIWEVTDGALTDEGTEIIWLAFGNPTQATGRFRECFGKYRHLWRTAQIDSREVEGTNKAYLDELVKTHGEDSDLVRVRVRGQFPAQSVAQFISTDDVEAAMRRQSEVDAGAPLVVGVDLARFGDDRSVLRFRSGKSGELIPPIKWANRDTVYSANMIANAIDTYRPRQVFVDNGYIGAAVVDILHSRNYHQVVGVDFGGAADDPRRFHNKRAEMWGLVKDWLKQGGCLDKDQTLQDDLVGPEMHFHKISGAIVLESKEEMKARGLASPDDGDALALTFAAPVARLDMLAPVGQGGRNDMAQTEYSMFT